jgi:alpha-galactosidase|tara:strand:- start:5641 stop:6984 length:1344 start_codon:yes stop_codon:yes gene_type:complete
MGDILSYPELAESNLTLFDIDEDRLRTSEIVAHRTAEALNVSPTIEVTTDRVQALDSADYVISMFQVAGYKPGTVTDFEIPKRYGLRQTIGDTLGIGGIMRALRTIPVFLDMASEMERLCPEVVHLNYVNPMAMNCWALNRATAINTVGLCHSVQGTAARLARNIGVPIEEIDYVCAGINHIAFYLSFERNGANLYPEISRVIDEDRIPEDNKVRYEMFRRLGYFVTESSEHFAEYVPWFIKRDRPDLIEEFNIPLDEYLRRCEVQLTGWRFMKQKLEDPSADLVPAFEVAMLDAGVPKEELAKVVEEFKNLGLVKRSLEYGSTIIHSIETGTPSLIYGNVDNDGLIDNLPRGCCVEVPCQVDGRGLHPKAVGSLPPQLAALMQTNINVQSLVVEAMLTGSREHIYHAAMFDPHTAAELDINQIHDLVDDLIEAHGSWLPEVFQDSA